MVPLFTSKYRALEVSYFMHDINSWLTYLYIQNSQLSCIVRGSILPLC